MEWLAAAALGTALAVFLVRAFAPRAVHGARAPEGDRVATLLARAGLEPSGSGGDGGAADGSRSDAASGGPTVDAGRVRVVETTSERAVDATLRGLPGRRELWVTAPLLDLDEDVAAALLAVEAGRVRHRVDLFQAVAAGTLVGILAAVLSGRVGFDLGLAGLGAAGLVAFAVGRRIEYAADAAAAERVGAATVADAYERVAAIRESELETASWRTYLEVEPPVGERVRRLRERA